MRDLSGAKAHRRECETCGQVVWSPLNLTITIKCPKDYDHGPMSQPPQGSE